MIVFHKSVATWFGLGLCPKAPGTMGSLGALPFAYAWAMLFPNHPAGTFFLLGCTLFVLSLYSVQQVIRSSGSKDPQFIVIDEVAGQWLTFSLLPTAALLESPWLLLLGFALFRFFDILKPLGIRRLEKLPGAWGVMLDDMLGGLYASLFLFLVWHSAGFVRY